MKCVHKDGVVRRVKDNVARLLVNGMDWMYMSKELYKDITKPNWRVKK